MPTPRQVRCSKGAGRRDSTREQTSQIITQLILIRSLSSHIVAGNSLPNSIFHLPCAPSVRSVNICSNLVTPIVVAAIVEACGFGRSTYIKGILKTLHQIQSVYQNDRPPSWGGGERELKIMIVSDGPFEIYIQDFVYISWHVTKKRLGNIHEIG